MAEDPRRSRPTGEPSANGSKSIRKRDDTVLSRPLTRQPRVSDETGFSAGTLILTLDGELPVEHLCAGDRIITRSGARMLKRIASIRVEGGYVVAPHTLGHGRPDAEITMGPKQKLLLRDWRARTLYGKDQAEVPVARLADGDYISPATGSVRLFQLEFARDEVIFAGGLEVTVHGQPG